MILFLFADALALETAFQNRVVHFLVVKSHTHAALILLVKSVDVVEKPLNVSNVLFLDGLSILLALGG